MNEVATPDFNEAGMSAWNSLTLLLEKDEELFDDLEKFEEFYFLIMERLMSEEEIDA